MFLLLTAVQPVEVKADENAEHDVYRKNLLKEVLDEDRRISSLAMFNLGFSYLSGNRPQDYVRAYMWFTISAARYKARAFYPLTSREKLILRMTPEQIESAEQMAHLTQIVREALSNVVHHAQATRVVVNLHCENGTMRLTVSDNGIAMPVATDERDEYPGRGILNMRTRARLMGGEFVLESTPGQGTQVMVTAPCGAEVAE